MAGAIREEMRKEDWRRVRLFAAGDVRLLEGPFKRAQDLDIEYLMRHDVERFLTPFRAEAGLSARAEKYPNWESSGLDGHTAGHYLSALAQAWAATGDARARERMEAMVAGLAECQRAHGDGYAGAVPGGRELWAGVRAGRIEASAFSLNGKWVPWYNLHKLFAGLRDAWVIGGSAEAREALVRLGDWCGDVVAGLDEARMQEMLRCEHGGMNEVLADLHAITGEERFLALARRFCHRAALEPLERGEDRLTGLHANTQIPKVIGMARIGLLARDRAYLDAARFFWATVVGRRSVAIGGNSVREHFHPADDFSSMIESREGPETCNTYNMLRLTGQLFTVEPDGRRAARYADYYERALFNHVLSSQHPGHGGLVYFTPMRPRHYRVYSQASECFWCCVGSGMENHTKYGEFIYAQRRGWGQGVRDAQDVRGSQGGGELWVNLFIASEVRWAGRGVTLRQETRFPDEERTRFRLGIADGVESFVLRVRHPEWVAGELRIRVNGERCAFSEVEDAGPGSHVAIKRVWRDGDLVEVELPMTTRLERLPDDSDYAAAVHGPIVLAAVTGTEGVDGLVAGDGRMAHIAPGPYLPLDGAPMLVGEGGLDAMAAQIRPVAGKPMTFSAPGLIRPAHEARTLELTPFARVHDARSIVYWRTVTPEKYDDVLKAMRAAEAARLALEARTLDQITPGEQQPEVEHRYRGEKSATGNLLGRAWRDAADGGWFAYDVRADNNEGSALELIVTHYGGERGREFDVLADGRVVASVTLRGGRPDAFVDEAYALPAGLPPAFEIKFVPRGKSRVAQIFGVRLVRAE